MTERRVQTNFTADDTTRRVSSGVLASNRDGVAAEAVPINVDPNQPPQGTAREVLLWVNRSPARAQQAIDAEEASGDPRKVLVSNLRKVLKASEPTVAQTQIVVEEKIPVPPGAPGGPLPPTAEVPGVDAPGPQMQPIRVVQVDP